MKNKLKVETLSNSVSRKKEKIAEYLLRTPEGATPKMISTATSINVNTIKSILPKLNNIETKCRGWYKVVNRGDNPSISTGDLLTWNFHNLILTFPMETHQYNSFELDYNMIKLSFLQATHQTTVRLSSDYPLNVSSIVMVYAFIAQRYPKLNLKMSDITIRSIEFNKDYSNLKFEGVNCITLDSLCSQFKLYQKSIGLRTEHKTKVPFTTTTMVDMLTSSPNTLDLNAKLNETKTQLAKLTAQSIYNTQQLNKLIGGQNGPR